MTNPNSLSKIQDTGILTEPVPILIRDTKFLSGCNAISYDYGNLTGVSHHSGLIRWKEDFWLKAVKIPIAVVPTAICFPSAATDFTQSAIVFIPEAINFTPAAIDFTPPAFAFTPPSIGFTPPAIGYTLAATKVLRQQSGLLRQQLVFIGKSNANQYILLIIEYKN